MYPLPILQMNEKSNLKRTISGTTAATESPENNMKRLKLKVKKNALETPHPNPSSRSEVYILPSSVGSYSSPAKFSPVPSKLKENTHGRLKTYGNKGRWRNIHQVKAKQSPGSDSSSSSSSNKLHSPYNSRPNSPKALPASSPTATSSSPQKNLRLSEKNIDTNVDPNAPSNFMMRDMTIDWNRPPSALSMYDYNSRCDFDVDVDTSTDLFNGVQGFSTPFKDAFTAGKHLNFRSGYTTPEDFLHSAWISDSLISPPKTMEWMKNTAKTEESQMDSIITQDSAYTHTGVDVEMHHGTVSEKVLEEMFDSLIVNESVVPKIGTGMGRTRSLDSSVLGPAAVIGRSRSGTVTLEGSPLPALPRRTRSGTIVSSSTLEPALPVIETTARRTRSGTIVGPPMPRRNRSGTIVQVRSTAALPCAAEEDVPDEWDELDLLGPHNNISSSNDHDAGPAQRSTKAVVKKVMSRANALGRWKARKQGRTGDVGSVHDCESVIVTESGNESDDELLLKPL